jgi:hypothetical protein
LFYLRLLCRIVPTCVNRDMSITHRQVTYRHVLSWLVTANLFYLVSSSAVHLYRIIMCQSRHVNHASSYVPICAILISYRTNLFDLVSSRPYRLFLCLSCIVRHSLALRIHLNYFDKSTYRLVLSVGYPLSLYRLLTRSILISHRSNSTCPIMQSSLPNRRYWSGWYHESLLTKTIRNRWYWNKTILQYTTALKYNMSKRTGIDDTWRCWTILD